MQLLHSDGVEKWTETMDFGTDAFGFQKMDTTTFATHWPVLFGQVQHSLKLLLMNYHYCLLSSWLSVWILRNSSTIYWTNITYLKRCFNQIGKTKSACLLHDLRRDLVTIWYSKEILHWAEKDSLLLICWYADFLQSSMNDMAKGENQDNNFKNWACNMCTKTSLPQMMLYWDCGLFVDIMGFIHFVQSKTLINFFSVHSLFHVTWNIT